MNKRGSELPDKCLGTSGIEESSQKVVVTAVEAPSQCGGMSDEFAVRATRSLAPSSCEYSQTLPEKVEHLRRQFLMACCASTTAWLLCRTSPFGHRAEGGISGPLQVALLSAPQLLW